MLRPSLAAVLNCCCAFSRQRRETQNVYTNTCWGNVICLKTLMYHYNGSTLSPKVSVPICLRLLFYFFLNKNRLEFSDLCYIIFQQKLARILRVMLYKSSCQKEAREVFIGCTMWSLDRCSNAMTYGTAVGLKIIGLKRLVRTKFWLLWERAHLLAPPGALYVMVPNYFPGGNFLGLQVPLDSKNSRNLSQSSFLSLCLQCLPCLPPQSTGPPSHSTGPQSQSYGHNMDTRAWWTVVREMVVMDMQSSWLNQIVYYWVRHAK